MGRPGPIIIDELSPHNFILQLSLFLLWKFIAYTSVIKHNEQNINFAHSSKIMWVNHRARQTHFFFILVRFPSKHMIRAVCTHHPRSPPLPFGGETKRPNAMHIASSADQKQSHRHQFPSVTLRLVGVSCDEVSALCSHTQSSSQQL